MTKTNLKSIKLLVRVAHPTLSSYQYQSKDQPVTQHVLEVKLLDIQEGQYCTGMAKGSLEYVQKMQKKFAEGTVWMMVEPSIDAHAKAQFISGPMKHVINLGGQKTTFTQQTAANILAGMPTSVVPQENCADICRIVSQRAIDALGLIRSVGDDIQVKTNKGPTVKANVLLVDGSELKSKDDPNKNELAVLNVAVWGQSEVKECRRHVGDLVLLTNLSATVHEKYGLQIGTREQGNTGFCVNPSSKRSAEILAMKEQLVSNNNIQLIANTGGGKVDTSGDQPLSCCSIQAALSELAEDVPDRVKQLMCLQVDIPGDEVLTKLQERIFFNTIARDFSGSLPLGVSEDAALVLAQVSTKEEFLEKHRENELVFAIVNLRVSRSVKPKNSGASQPVESSAWINVTAQDATIYDFARMPPTQEARKLAILMEQFGSNEGAMIAAPLSLVKPSAFYNIEVNFATMGGHSRYAEKILAFVQGTTNTKPEAKDNGFDIVSEKLIDLLGDKDGPKYSVQSLANKGEMLKFIIDKGSAVLVLNGAPKDPAKDAFVVEKVIRIEPKDVDATKAAMERLMNLSAAVTADSRKRSFTCTTPTSTDKKCRTIDRWPTDEA